MFVLQGPCEGSRQYLLGSGIHGHSRKGGHLASFPYSVANALGCFNFALLCTRKKFKAKCL